MLTLVAMMSLIAAPEKIETFNSIEGTKAVAVMKEMADATYKAGGKFVGRGTLPQSSAVIYDPDRFLGKWVEFEYPVFNEWKFIDRREDGVVFEVQHAKLGRWLVVVASSSLAKVEFRDISKCCTFLGRIAKVITASDDLGRVVQIPLVRVYATMIETMSRSGSEITVFRTE